MNILKMAKEQRQKDARFEAEVDKHTKVATAALADAMDSVIIPPVDDFTPTDMAFPGITTTPAYKPPVEKTPEEQDAIAVLSSMPAIMEPVKYRQLQIDTMNTAKAQKAALEKVQAKVTGAINHRDLVIKGCKSVLAIMDGKPAAKPTPPKKPATPTAPTGKRRGRKPAVKVEEKKASPPNPAPGSTGE